MLLTTEALSALELLGLPIPPQGKHILYRFRLKKLLEEESEKLRQFSSGDESIFTDAATGTASIRVLSENYLPIALHYGLERFACKLYKGARIRMSSPGSVPRCY